MKNYPLLRLLVLREHRAELAKVEVARQQRLLTQVIAEAQEAERIAKEFVEWRPKKETALFESIRNQVLEQKSLDIYHSELANLSAKELKLLDEAEQAREKVKEVERDLARALNAYQEALGEVRKFEEHRTNWWRAENQRRENLEELEAEEVAGIAAQRRNQKN